MLNEELLAVWLRLTSVADNQRLAERLPFNEAVVCGLLFQAQEAGGCMTAGELCRRTCILKSQMTAILRSLEGKGLIERRQSRADRRQVELRLLPEGTALYQASHRQSVGIADRLIEEMGEEKIRTLLPLLGQAADIFKRIVEEV